MHTYIHTYREDGDDDDGQTEGGEEKKDSAGEHGKSLTILVKNIADEAVKDDLVKLFEECGSIKEARLANSKAGKICFIDFE